jgi:hypothetical protein
MPIFLVSSQIDESPSLRQGLHTGEFMPTSQLIRSRMEPSPHKKIPLETVMPKTAHDLFYTKIDHLDRVEKKSEAAG